MAYRQKSASLTVVLALLLSLHSTTSFYLNPSNSVSRIQQVRIASSPLVSTGHAVHSRHHRYTAVGAVDAAPFDACEPRDDSFSRLKTTRVLAFLHTCFTRYLHLCETRPFVINSIAAGVLAGVGDTLAQSLQTSSATVAISSFNWVRWRRFTLTGLLFEGPWMTCWYKCLKELGRWMENKFQSGPRQQVLGQVVAGRTLGAVLFFPMYFIVYDCIGSVLSGQVPKPIMALNVCRAGIAAVLSTQCKVWPVIDWINFSFVPEPLRVLFCSLVTLFWNIYMAGALAGAAK